MDSNETRKQRVTRCAEELSTAIRRQARGRWKGVRTAQRPASARASVLEFVRERDLIGLPDEDRWATASGRRALGAELESWTRFHAGLEAVLRTT